MNFKRRWQAAFLCFVLFRMVAWVVFWGWNGVLFGADLLADSVALEKEVSAIVVPLLHEAPAANGTVPGHEENTKTEGAKSAPIAPNGRAWGIVVGVVSSKGRHVFGYGRVAADSAVRPDRRTLFEIASVTKTFTALLLADSVERGKVNLDAPVRLYLPESVTMPQRGDKEITLLHLATHTSGLPRIPFSIRVASFFPTNPYKNYGAKDLYDTLTTTKLTRDPGEQYEYSNLGYGLLGHALSRQAKSSYEELVVERICRPLKLSDTQINLSDDQKLRFAPPYAPDGTRSSNWEFDVLAGAGALRSTTDDMLTYLEANMGIKKCELLPAMQRCHHVRNPAASKMQSVGLGWHIETRPDDARLVFHGGGTLGYSSLLGFVEKDGQTQFGIVVLSNAGPAVEGMVANDVAVKLIGLLQSKRD
jgi:CubicO group peptidase (beta-lactamase class C family)